MVEGFVVVVDGFVVVVEVRLSSSFSTRFLSVVGVLPPVYRSLEVQDNAASGMPQPGHREDRKSRSL